MVIHVTNLVKSVAGELLENGIVQPLHSSRQRGIIVSYCYSYVDFTKIFDWVIIKEQL